MFSVFVKLKVIVNENVSFINHGPGIRLWDGCKLAINQKKKHNFVKIYRHDVIVNFFDVVSILFLILGTGFSIMTGSAVMTVFV